MKKLLGLIAIVTVFASTVAFAERDGIQTCRSTVFTPANPNICPDIDLQIGFEDPAGLDGFVFQYFDPTILAWITVNSNVLNPGETCQQAFVRLQTLGFTDFQCVEPFEINL